MYISGKLQGEANELLAQEVMKYHKEKGPARCTLKIDLMKAYDFVVGSTRSVCFIGYWLGNECYSKVLCFLQWEFGGLFQGKKGFYARRSSIPISICISYRGVFQADAADGE